MCRFDCSGRDRKIVTTGIFRRYRILELIDTTETCGNMRTGWQRKQLGILCLTLVVIVCGCRITTTRHGDRTKTASHNDPVPTPSYHAITNDDLPMVKESLEVTEFEYSAPITSRTVIPDTFNEIRLDKAIEIGLSNSKILRSLGGRLLELPSASTAVYDPAIQYSDPVFGVEAALAQFDAQLSGSMTYANNDDVNNNTSSTVREVQQDLFSTNLQLSKTTASGTQFSLHGFTQHDNNNLPPGFNLFNSSWTTVFEAQVRQPLLQGRGVAFNRIAGPIAQPGFRTTSGVLISRINEDISIADFERAVRNYVNEVISSYWQLYFAYRSYDAAKSARDNSATAWNMIKARFVPGVPGGEADKEAQAREQYFSFAQQVVSSLNGDERNGRAGILQAEANLRRLLGMAQSDGNLLRPADEPLLASVSYEWQPLAELSIDSRVELRQQRWRLKQRELELLASRNFLLPRLDATATFRNNGFGDDLLGGGAGRFASAGKDAFSGDHNEVEFGVQLNVPIGYRQASAGVRNSELNLCRERAILKEQQQQVLHDLGTSVRQMDQSFESLTFARNRLIAAREVLEARNAAYSADTVSADLLLEAQRRLIEAEISYHQAEVDHAIANESISLQSGQLLTKHGVILQGSSTGAIGGEFRAPQQPAREAPPKPVDDDSPSDDDPVDGSIENDRDDTTRTGDDPDRPKPLEFQPRQVKLPADDELLWTKFPNLKK